MRLMSDPSFSLVSPINRALKYAIISLALAAGTVATAQTLPTDSVTCH